MEINPWMLVITLGGVVATLGAYIAKLHADIAKAKEAHIRLAERVANLARNGGGNRGGDGED
jgi:hypothetical protein